MFDKETTEKLEQNGLKKIDGEYYFIPRFVFFLERLFFKKRVKVTEEQAKEIKNIVFLKGVEWFLFSFIIPFLFTGWNVFFYWKLSPDNAKAWFYVFVLLGLIFSFLLTVSAIINTRVFLLINKENHDG